MIDSNCFVTAQMEELFESERLVLFWNVILKMSCFEKSEKLGDILEIFA